MLTISVENTAPRQNIKLNWRKLTKLVLMLTFYFEIFPINGLITGEEQTHKIPGRNLPITLNIMGFGISTTAGSGRHQKPPNSKIIRITSLADSGPHTLRQCINDREPRTCLFEIAGDITLASPLILSSPYITIAGQTAPSPGITILGAGLSIETHDVFIQHIAIRPGDSRRGAKPQNRDAISIGAPNPQSAYNVVIDHISATWAIDENITTWHENTHDITIANSIIAEGLHYSIHPKGPHSKGVMIGDNTKRITLYRNLISSNEERNPYVKPGSSSEVINNVVYGWGAQGGWSLCNLSNNEGNSNPLTLSFIGNSYVPGPWSYLAPPLYAKQISPWSRVFAADSQLLMPTNSQAPSLKSFAAESIPFVAAPPLKSAGMHPLSSDIAYRIVLATSGSRPYDRSATDKRIISDVEQRRGYIKDCLTGCSNAVGFWQKSPTYRRNLRLPRKPFEDNNRDGYTNLENWLQRRSRDRPLK